MPVEEPVQESRTAAPQVHRRPAQEPERRQQAPAAAQQQPPLADFLIRKLGESGAMNLDDLSHFAIREGYFAEGDNPDRAVHATLMNVVKAGFIRQLPNGTFAPATVMDTIRLRRAIYTSRGGDQLATLEVVDVPGRTLIKIHPANFASQLLGCQAPGLGATFGSRWMVTHSRAAHRQLMHQFNLAGDDDLRLIVTSHKLMVPPRPTGANIA